MRPNSTPPIPIARRRAPVHPQRQRRFAIVTVTRGVGGGGGGGGGTGGVGVGVGAGVGNRGTRRRRGGGRGRRRIEALREGVEARIGEAEVEQGEVVRVQTHLRFDEEFRRRRRRRRRMSYGAWAPPAQRRRDFLRL